MPDYLDTLLQQWMIDPCGDEPTEKAGQYILQALEPAAAVAAASL